MNNHVSAWAFAGVGLALPYFYWVTPPELLMQRPLVLTWGACWLSFLLLLWQIWLLRAFAAPRPPVIALGLAFGCLAQLALQLAASRVLLVWLTRFQHSLFALELILLSVFGLLPLIRAGRSKMLLGFAGGLLMGWLLQPASFNMHAVTELSRPTPKPSQEILGPWAAQPTWFLQLLWPRLEDLSHFSAPEP